MPTIKLFQTVALLLIIAMAASCAMTKDYSTRIFPARNEPVLKRDTAAMALRFLDLDTADSEKANWISTAPIMGRDTSLGTAILDNFSNKFGMTKKDSIPANGDVEKNKNAGMVIVADTTPSLRKEEPVARSYDRSPVRTRRSREAP